MDKAKINIGFTNIYEEYESLNAESPMSKWKRQRVYSHLEKYLNPNSRILEINAGSCIDAAYLCSKGHSLHATDISDGFLKHAEQKASALNLEESLTYERISFTELNQISTTGFDHVFSNFAGLNCVEKIESVLQSFKPLLNPNGKVTMVILPKIAPWEWLRIRFGFSEGFRRFKKSGVTANISGSSVNTYYHPVSKIKKSMKDDYVTLQVENLGFFMPSVDKFSMENQKLFTFFANNDSRFQKLMPKGIGDFYIITLQLKN